MTYSFAATVEASEGGIDLEVWGVDGSEAISDALGCASSEIPLPGSARAFELRVTFGSQTDRYRIELTEGGYTYSPKNGAISEINDYLDDAPADGAARIQRL